MGEKVVEVGDGEVLIRPWMYHRLFPVVDLGEENRDGDEGRGEDGERKSEGKGKGKGKRCVFLLSGQETGEQFKLDTLFFQNWYGYQDEIIVRERKMDLTQVMCVSFLFELKGFFGDLAFVPSSISPLSSGGGVGRTSGLLVQRPINQPVSESSLISFFR